jgi:2-dehydropantoate 2-reductase
LLLCCGSFANASKRWFALWGKAMKVAIVGAGAIGGFYGLMLARAGHDVHFVVRGDYAVVKKQGMRLLSAELQDFSLFPVNVYQDVAELPACELILVATKATSNADIAPALARAAAPGSAVVVLQNGFGVEDAFRAVLPDNVHLLGGLCIVSVHRDAPGVIHHFGLGGLNIGYHSGPDNDKSLIESRLEHLFQQANVDLKIMPCLITARWQKLVMNIPFNGLTVSLDSGTKPLRTHPETRKLVRQLMDDVAAAARLCGYPLPDGYVDQAWQTADGPDDYQSSMHVDFKAGRALELDAIYAAPLAAVEVAGGEMPRVKMLYQMLCFLDQRNRNN